MAKSTSNSSSPNISSYRYKASKLAIFFWIRLHLCTRVFSSIVLTQVIPNYKCHFGHLFRVDRGLCVSSTCISKTEKTGLQQASAVSQCKKPIQQANQCQAQASMLTAVFFASATPCVTPKRLLLQPNVNDCCFRNMGNDLCWMGKYSIITGG
jgi:hypothetical protein